MTCNDATLSLGVYLLGALEPAERAEVEAHLAICAACRRELDDLVALPALLDRLRLEDVELLGAGPQHAAVLDAHSEVAAPSEDLFERFAARARDDTASDDTAFDDAARGEQLGAELAARRTSRFTRFRLLTSAAAAVVVIGGGIGIGIGVSHHSSGPRTIHAQLGTVQMDVDLAGQTTGTTLDLEVSGLPDDEHCRLIAVAKDGTRDTAGQWNATYSGKAKFWGSTSIPRSDLKQLVLLGTHGQTLVTASV